MPSGFVMQDSRADRSTGRAEEGNNLARLQLLEHVLEQLPIPVTVVDADGGRIFTNARAQALLTRGEETTPPPILVEAGAAIPVKSRDGRVEATIEILKESTEATLADNWGGASFEARLLGMVSHDLRDPLQAISLASATLLRASTGGETTVTRGLQRIHNAAGRAARMVRDLLDCTQVQLEGHIALRLGRVNLDGVIDDALEEVRARFPARPIERCRSGPDIWGTWDADRLAQIAVNLISNAFKYSPDDSPLRLSTKLNEADGLVSFEVHNQGEAIAPEHMASLFKPLERMGKTPGHPHGGLGLGLFIVGELVCAHKGSVTVNSDPASGTTFIVRLPKSSL
jgi:signal transduction histidine kinase